MTHRYGMLLLCLLYATLQGHGFSYETPIKNSCNYVAIESLQSNNFIEGYERESGIPVLQTVVACSRKIISNYVVLQTRSGCTIKTSSEQCFYSTCLHRWLSIEDLEKHAEYRDHLNIVSIQRVNEPLHVCVIEVSDTHTYYVSHDNLLTHNAIFAIPIIIAFEGLAFELLAIESLKAFAVGCALWGISKIQEQKFTANPNAGKTCVNPLPPQDIPKLPQEYITTLPELNNAPLITTPSEHTGPGSVITVPAGPNDTIVGTTEPCELNKTTCLERNDNNQIENASKRGGRLSPEELMQRRQEGKEWAQENGWVKTKNYPFNAHGEAVYQKSRDFITIDNTDHNGCFWKMFDSKGRREGSFSKDLIYVKD